jgi:tRNA threonylcarbamoyladenosine biosynthesis protein TsaE
MCFNPINAMPAEDEILLTNLDQTRNLARLLGAAATPGVVLLLGGGLGSGKTTFVQGVGAGLGISTVINSPTFVLIQEYWQGRLPLFHADLYRLDPLSVLDLGLEELWSGSGVVAVEWPERLPALPQCWLELQLQWAGEESRLVKVRWQGETHGHLWQRVLERYARMKS